MGIDFTGLIVLFNSLKYTKNRKNIITLGRQEIHLDKNIIKQLLNKEYSGFCENLLSDIGFENIDSIDNSSYEGATILHNMNKPIPENLKNKYDFVLDLGTTEHIFNIPQVCENIIDLLNIDGIYVCFIPNNNCSGHGIYQFSPEFFLSTYTKKYGMEILELYISKVNDVMENWINVNNYGNNNFRNMAKFSGNEEVYIMAIIRKISNDRENLILNPPNQFSYEEVDWKKNN